MKVEPRSITKPHLNIGALSGLEVRQSNYFGNPTVQGFKAADYNLTRVMNAGLDIQFHKSLETEVSQSMSRDLGLYPNGVFVPSEILCRDLAVGTGNIGGDLVMTDVRATIADALRPFSAVVAAKATVLNDLRGNVSYPRFSAQSSPSGYGENVSVIDANTATQRFSNMSLSPKRISSQVLISTQLLKTAHMDAERFIRKEILRSIGQVLDLYVLTGNGPSGTPPACTGFLNLTENGAGGTDLSKLSPGVTFGATATWSKLVLFSETLHAANIQND
jgi:HK97 family phage major capsid protein